MREFSVQCTCTSYVLVCIAFNPCLYRVQPLGSIKVLEEFKENS